MSVRTVFLAAAVFAVSGLAADSAVAMQRMANPAAGGRMANPMMGGSLRYGVSPVTANSMINPAMGSLRFQPGFNQGVIQPSDFRVPFTYLPGYNWPNRLPYGYWGNTWGGVPYFWWNSFWYRSMWYRGMPYFIPIPVNTVPPQVMQQWNQYTTTPQYRQLQEILKKQKEQEEKAKAANQN